MFIIPPVKRLPWHKAPSFFAAMIALIATALAAANPIHGTVFELIGIVCIFVSWLGARLGW